LRAHVGALTPELSYVFSQCHSLGSKKGRMKRRNILAINRFPDFSWRV
jgi:hypothetical protein